MDFEVFLQKIAKVKANINQVFIGKEETVELLLTALLSRGHVLLEDVPGMGKTILAKTLARSLDLTFKRVQFTPDLLPSDVVGVNVYNQKIGEFEFKPGPISTNILLADEINRATPKTQSSLLEAMEERQYSVEGDTRQLPEPFMVLATQNPVDMQGTFPLPEAQLDRFLLKISFGYPTMEEEWKIINRFAVDNPLVQLDAVIKQEDVVAMQGMVDRIYIHSDVARYLLNITRKTREHPRVSMGASPRASLWFHKAARALAAIRGRTFVVPDDVKDLSVPVLSHRILLHSHSFIENVKPDDIIREVVQEVPVPVESMGDWGK